MPTGTAARARFLAPLAGLVLASSGCSAILVSAPPRPYDPARQPSTCDTVLAPAVADIFLAALATTGVAVSLATTEGGEAAGRAALYGVLDAAFIASAIHGISHRDPCVELKATIASCRSGDDASCRLLDPGHQPGRAPTAPLLCASDAGCGDGQRCVASSCQAKPPTAP
jgi:hypothetical protein